MKNQETQQQALSMIVAQALIAIDETKQCKASESDTLKFAEAKAAGLIAAASLAFAIYTGTEAAENAAYLWFSDYKRSVTLAGPSTAILSILEDAGCLQTNK